MFIAGCDCLLTWEVATITQSPGGQTGDGPPHDLPECGEARTTGPREPPSQTWQESESQVGTNVLSSASLFITSILYIPEKQAWRKQHNLALCLESPSESGAFLDQRAAPTPPLLGVSSQAWQRTFVTSTSLLRIKSKLCFSKNQT